MSNPHVGTWKFRADRSKASAEGLRGAPPTIEITPYDQDGLTTNIPEFEVSLAIKFDGRDYEVQGPGVPEGTASSGTRIDSHRVLVTDKSKGKVLHTTEWKVSPDSTTLTMTVDDPGTRTLSVFVYERE